MNERTFTIKKGKDDLIDITAIAENVKRRGKYIYSIWMGALTINEANNLIESLKQAMEGENE